MQNLFKKGLILLFLFFACPTWGQGDFSATLIADAQSGYLFLKENTKVEMPPASLTKLMTLYLTFSALEKGWLKWEDELPVSEYAASQPRTHLGLFPGQKLTVRQAVEGMIVHSANDAAVVLAEALGKDEARFSQIMTQTAQQLNMFQTEFKNASGLHVEGQKTTAHDMALLALALIHHFPQYYPLFSKTSFDYNGRSYTTHNRLLSDYPGTEGMKTGYVSAVGYNMISTVQQNGSRLVGIILGADSGFSRDQKMQQLLDRGFQFVQRQKKAVEDGLLSPAMDPLHQRILLRKTDLAIYAPDVPQNIKMSMKRIIVPQISPSNETRFLGGSDWAIQVGAFRSMNQAVKMSQRAFNLLEMNKLKIVSEPAHSLYRAQLVGFSDKKDAIQACNRLNQKDCPCIIVMKS